MIFAQQLPGQGFCGLFHFGAKSLLASQAMGPILELIA